MDAKLDCEVDVEGAVGAVDMMVRGEDGLSISRRPCLRPNTAHSPRASRQPPNECPGLGVFHVTRTTSSFPNQFPVHIFTAVQRPQPEPQRSGIQDLLGPILYSSTMSYTAVTQLRVPAAAATHSNL